MPHLTLTVKSKATQLSPCLVASYDIRPGSGVGLFSDTHKCLLALDPHRASVTPTVL